MNQVVDSLRAKGIGAAVVSRLADIRARAHSHVRSGDRVRSIDYQIIHDHPIGGEVDLVAETWHRLDGRTVPPRAHAPCLGTHTLEILRDLGYSAEEIDRLLANCAVATQVTEDGSYIPD